MFWQQNEELKSKGLGNKSNRSESTDYDQEEKLWTDGQLGSSTPEAFQNTFKFMVYEHKTIRSERLWRAQ